MSFIFISYSRQDQAYVSTLVQALQSHRLPVWIDDRIDYGSTWPRVIQDHLEQCSVFLVVMSPRSEKSHWVQCELSLALELKKPIFPILLEGRQWLNLATIHTYKVTKYEVPSSLFFETLKKHLNKKANKSKKKTANSYKKRLLCAGFIALIYSFWHNHLMPKTWQKEWCNFRGGAYVAENSYRDDFSSDSPRRPVRDESGRIRFIALNNCKCVFGDNRIRNYYSDSQVEVDPLTCK